MIRSRRVLILVALLGLAFALRLYKLGAVPLRGDEAFAVRYWAAPPSDVLRDLASWEPHPFGTFLGFWAWKSAAGDSVFAMRYLPLLGNLIGAAAVAALARRLFHSDRTAFLAAFLWAVNPFLIWHAQDVRNYALWAGFSPLAMLLFLRAADRNRPRHWALYVLAEAVALNTFFLEAFFLPVQGAYLLALRPTRAVLRRAVVAWAALAVLLTPWFVQIWYLSGSGYSGTTEQPTLHRLVTWVFPSLLTGGELHFPWTILFYLACSALFALAFIYGFRARVYWWPLIWIALPMLFWLAATTRMDIFNPRYLIAVTPALLLLIARALETSVSPSLHVEKVAGGEIWILRRPLLILLLIPLIGVSTLIDYYEGDNPKSGDWPALAAYLEDRARPRDLIVQTMADPAFGYYYHGGADETSLEPGVSAAPQLIDDLNFYRTFWLIGRSPDAETYLSDHLQTISFDTLRGFSIMQFRRWEPSESEIQTQADITFDDIVRLRGYTIQGSDTGSRAITVILYWEPLKQTGIDYKVFVHLVGPPHPATGSPLWDQDDHYPPEGSRQWQVGTLIRDPYHLLKDPAITLAPAEYAIRVGFYDPDTNTRLSVYAADGSEAGDSYPLVTWHWPK
jgi:hypothetical protein